MSMLLTRPVLSVPMLRVCRRILHAAADTGTPGSGGAEILRTVTGYALTELSWLCAVASETELQRPRRVTRMLPDDLPDDLLEVAMAVCGQGGKASHFATGLDLTLSRPGGTAAG